MPSLPTIGNRQFAEEANKYAREHIFKGETQLINNEYSISQRIALKKAVKDIREAIDDLDTR